MVGTDTRSIDAGSVFIDADTWSADFFGQSSGVDSSNEKFVTRSVGTGNASAQGRTWTGDVDRGSLDVDERHKYSSPKVIMKISTILVMLVLATRIIAADVSLYDQARELYKQGPTKGPEIVRLLREHIRANPKDGEAVRLLGITLFGIEKPDEALPVIDRAIEIAGEKKEISPQMQMLRARTLYELHRYWECKHELEVYWAFWQDSPELKKLYDWYYPRVAEAKEIPRANQAPVPAATSVTPAADAPVAPAAAAAHL